MIVPELPVSAEYVYDVPETELSRLLGYPSGRRMTDEIEECVGVAKRRFASYARPRVFLRDHDDGIAAAITVGREVESELAALWHEGCVDEAFVLDRLCVAVVESLARTTVARLAGLGVFVLPPKSPGNGGWSLAAQHELYHGLGALAFETIDMLPSGMLRPVASLLALYPFATGHVGSGSERESTPCSVCRSRRCPYRRAA
jgi:hypothetical protein